MGEHIGGFPHYKSHLHVEWATLRCNALAFALLACSLRPGVVAVPCAAVSRALCGRLLGKFQGTVRGRPGRLPPPPLLPSNWR